ncbi:hypothetical protein [Endozoicomonas sp.]|uniref:hypothetical protein n=1 Tax=Endozoicomonas sp. TaxID=1892382 RepID=UPI00383A535E
MKEEKDIHKKKKRTSTKRRKGHPQMKEEKDIHKSNANIGLEFVAVLFIPPQIKC